MVFLLLCLILQLYFILGLHRKLGSFKGYESNNPIMEPVSVIICAKNELKNLEKNLIQFLDQDYPDFEVIVVNDCSNDGSDYLLNDLSLIHKHLRVVTINDHPRFKHGKKFVLTLGIKASKNENLIFSDADCFPASNQWLKCMQRNFNDQTDIVLAYSPYEFEGSLLNRFIRYETFITALNYLSFALSGKPYMGVGRNMAYKKSLFFKGKGFASHMHILSGDDDLFVNQNANSSNTRIEVDLESQIWSEPKKSISSYFFQKIRHFGAGKAYKSVHKFILGLQVISGFLFYLFLIALIVLGFNKWIIASIYFIRLFAQIIVYAPILRKLRYKDLIWWLPVFDFVYSIYLVLINFIVLFWRRVVWR